ncbi:TraB/GumN family protein [Aliisedimentitalea scapharcae]|uniref:TraB/GumN family protein n=1 Tax=Aliisedimentitalea scapharcae TaxID=1524259 RepID=A0ABZ2XXX6_9RHOB
MKLLAFCFLLLVGAGTAQARCSGIDYRTQLSPTELANLKREAAKVPFAYGNHWIATRGGRRIHIIGTLHDGDRRMVRVMRNLRPVLDRADAALFEVTDQDLDGNIFERQLGHFTLPAQTRLQDLLTEDTWALLSRLATARGLNPAKVDTLQPWAASMFLISDTCTMLGIGPTRGLDSRIERYAIRKRIPIGALETVGESFAAFSRVPLRDQVRNVEIELQMMLADKPDDSSVVEAYFEEAVWESILLQRWIMRRYARASDQELRRYWQRFDKNLITTRNLKWTKRILATQGDTLVVAVGAAHLPGHSGLLNLLKARGYRLERAPW